MAVAALPVHEPDEPLTLPVTLPVSGPVNVPAIVPPVIFTLFAFWKAIEPNELNAAGATNWNSDPSY